MQKTAVIDESGKYRYRLGRIWDEEKPTLGWIMLNPSTADADEDDPTIRRCIRFAQDRSYGSIDVGNIFALRSTDPSLLMSPWIDDIYYDPFGKENLSAIKTILRESKAIVAAWGAQERIFRYNPAPHRLVAHEISTLGFPKTFCLGKTQKGYPRHPLYVRAEQPFQPYLATEGA